MNDSEGFLTSCPGGSPSNPELPTTAWASGDKSPAAAEPATTPSVDTCPIPAPLLDHPRYQVLGLLGVGGMGAVYWARHRLMGRTVALKVINPRLVDQPAMLERFRREVQAAARLSHPNIVTAHDAEQAGAVHFLVLEYVVGTPLDRLVREQGPLPVEDACNYVRQAALGLEHAHECGMVHRDIKPQNLMLTPEGQVKILDFGLAHFVSEHQPTEALTGSGVFMGTPDYIAPEQARDAHAADIRADLYSLGCTLYFLLAGRPPFPGGTLMNKVTSHLERQPLPLAEFRPEVPQELLQVLNRMMAKNPTRRYQTPGEVAEALAPFSRPTVTLARRPRRLWPWFAVALLALGGPLVLAVLGLSAYLLAPTVYRVATNQGVLVIETDDPQVQVIVKQGGELVTIIDTKSDRTVQLKAGNYELELAGGEGGLHLSTDRFSLRRGGREIVKVRLEQAPVGPPAPLAGHPQPPVQGDIALGMALRDRGEVDRAVAEFSEAIRRDPTSAEGYMNRGIAYRDKKAYVAAIADFDRARSLRPEWDEIYLNRGMALRMKGDYDKAIDDFNEALRLRPQFHETYTNRGVAYREQGKFDQAFADFQEAIRLNPDWGVSYRERGITYQQLKEYDKALADFNEAIRLSPTDPTPFARRGQVYRALGEEEKARRDERKAQELKR